MFEKRSHKKLEKSVEALENKGPKNMPIKERLEEIEGLYKALLEITTQGILIHDNGVFVECNPAFAKMFKYKTEELMGKSALDILALPEYRDLVCEKMLNGFEQPYEIMTKRKDGIVIPVMIVAAREIRYKNRILRMAAIRDLTEQKQTGKSLQRSEAFLNAIIENIPDMIFVKDANELRFVLFNKAGEDLLGYQREELIGKTDYDFFPKHESDFFTQKDREVLEKGGLVVIPEETVQTRKKGLRFVTTKKIPILYKGDKAQYLLGISADLTDWKRSEEEKRNLEQQLRQAQKMDSIGNLAGGIAHDFNNILSSIIGFTELSLDDVERGSPIEDNLQEVYRAGKRARDLVKQILAFARQSDEERKPIQVDTIAEEALKLIRSTIPTSIEIKKNIESNSLIMGNPTQVHQLFMNLCTNAAQTMEERGGIIEVGLADVEIDDRSSLIQLGLKPGNYIKMTVSDTGSGIDPSIIDSIFEPYFTTKGVGEGTGMGLALVYGIVENHRGKITIDSELGKGTTFSIYLPITKKRDAYRPYDPGELPSGNERILFVDDELPIAKMGSQILERLGYQVTVRTSSVEALELFRPKPDDFDLVITDMAMPNMTGDKLAVELMKIRPDIPVILCTGYSKKISDEIATAIGIKAFAYKPIVKAEMAKTVRKVLDESKS